MLAWNKTAGKNCFTISILDLDLIPGVKMCELRWKTAAVTEMNISGGFGAIIPDHRQLR